MDNNYEKLYSSDGHFIKIVGVSDDKIEPILCKLEECDKDIMLFNIEGEIIEETLDRLPFYYTQKDTNVIKIYPGGRFGIDDYGKSWTRIMAITRQQDFTVTGKLFAIYARASANEAENIRVICDSVKELLK
jgi:hypothetical protein